MGFAFTFTKYQGTGNDFILVDDRAQTFPVSDFVFVASLCNRRFGIGADGLILLQESLSPAHAFAMVYHNSDGRPSTFCGNGSRCIMAFAASLGLVKPGIPSIFLATDGEHTGTYHNPEAIDMHMNARLPIHSLQLADGTQAALLQTGSPHLIVPVADTDSVDVQKMGAQYRYEPQFAPHGGVNVNFVQRLSATSLKVRTYERGVEAETLSCGTGVTASALWAATGHRVQVQTLGGMLKVTSMKDWSQVILSGPAHRIFTGTWPQI